MVEVLLSTDNICLFHRIFEHFKVPIEIRPATLYVGTPFMVIVRAALFFALKGIYDYLLPLMFAIGLFCMYQGCVLFYMSCTGEEEEEDDPSSSFVVVWGKKLLGDRLLASYEGSSFWVYVDGVLKFTPLVLCICVLEVTDVVFCIDGVSTIFMVDHVHILPLYVGDIVAAVIVRALYPQLAGTVELFPDLNYSVSVVLVLVGVDMCAGVFGHDFPPGTLAAAMAVLFAIGIGSSIIRGTCVNPDEGKGNAAEGDDDREDGREVGYGTIKNSAT